MRPAARLRRAYFDCRYGQLHVYQAIPSGGGFDEATALLCVPGVHGVGSFFQPLLGPLGSDRSIYAPDLPGCGRSDPAGDAVGAMQYAQALLDLLDSLRQRRVDVLAHGSGAHTALVLAEQRPGALLRRLVCSAPPAGFAAAALAQRLDYLEVGLAGADDTQVAPAAITAQFSSLVGFLGAAPGA